MRKTAKQNTITLKRDLVSCNGCSQEKGGRKNIKPYPATRPGNKPDRRVIKDLVGRKLAQSSEARKYITIVREDC